MSGPKALVAREDGSTEVEHVLQRARGKAHKTIGLLEAAVPSGAEGALLPNERAS